ncbi:MAG: DUF1080 domain-containing protein [Bacteroidales bacterium]|nr:DUF1080 domain-containing protein [Bacteroidales bacterium]
MKKKTLKMMGLSLMLLCVSMSGYSQKTIDLFNGKDLSNWTLFVDPESGVNPSDVYKVNDGIIEIAGKPFGCMYTKQQYENYKLHVEWRWPNEKANSGIFLFMQTPTKLWPNAIECQLHAGDAGDFVLLGGSDLKEFKLNKGEKRPEYPIVRKMNQSNEMTPGEWNNAEIFCKNGKITVYINGTLQNKATKPSDKKGFIGLQSEGGPIQFRNVRLTPQ